MELRSQVRARSIKIIIIALIGSCVQLIAPSHSIAAVTYNCELAGTYSVTAGVLAQLLCVPVPDCPDSGVCWSLDLRLQYSTADIIYAIQYNAVHNACLFMIIYHNITYS